MQTKIKPVQVFPDYATTLEVSSVRINKLGNEGHAMAGWKLLTDDGNEVQAGGVNIESAEYSSWSNDDSYVLNLVASKLGLTIL